MQKRPPVAPAPPGSDRLSRSSKSSGSAQHSGSSKSSRRNSTDSPSGSASIPNGKLSLDIRLRSLLSHELGLPLFHALHGRDPWEQKYLTRESRSIPHACGDGILEQAHNEWVEHSSQHEKKHHERDLTKRMSQKITSEFEEYKVQSEFEVGVKNMLNSQQEAHQKGRMDILLSSEEQRPLALIEVGRENLEWWAKFDQACKYLDIMNSDSIIETRQFKEAMLCGILTIGDNKGTNEVRFGVFLCWPKSIKRCRMALLWHSHTFDLPSASKDFGRFLRVVASFAVWRKTDPETDYQYLSSNVCRVDNTVSWLPSCCLALAWEVVLIFVSDYYSCFIFLHLYCNRCFGVMTLVFARQNGLL